MQLRQTVALVACIVTINAFNSNTSTYDEHQYNSSHPILPPTNGTLLPGYRRNVSTGAAWVLPASRLDLGARAMTCECFDPDANCCMPSSNDHAPFCTPKDATCCSDTLCIAGETCCGDYCCRAETTCSTDPMVPGCCPKDKVCNTFNSTSVCLNASSTYCKTSPSTPNKTCCPPRIPYCRSFGMYGYGCFGSPVDPRPSPSHLSSSTSSGSGSGGSSSSSSRSTSTPNKPYRGSTTIVETVSINIVSSALSLQFPGTITLPENLAGWSIATTYVFSFPSTVYEGHPSVSSSSAQASSHATASSKTIPRSTSSDKSTATSTQRSTLCFDPDVQSPVPCSQPPSDPQYSSVIYPAATTLHSSATRTIASVLNLYSILSVLAFLYILVSVDFVTRIYVAALGIMSGGVVLYWFVMNAELREQEARRRGGEVQRKEKTFAEQVRQLVVSVVYTPLMVGWETVRMIKRDYYSTVD